jgi:MOSC domain-containing protein YiiM
MQSFTADELGPALESIRSSPATNGLIELIVRRPALRQREVVDEAELDPALGLVGDMWHLRPSRHTDDGGPHPGMQVTVMNARAIALVAGTLDRWPLAGDQLFVDLDLSLANLPTGTRLEAGSAVVEVTGVPHNGCAKFREHFGVEAVRLVNSPEGKALRLRGINTRVIIGGRVRPGDPIRKTS